MKVWGLGFEVEGEGFRANRAVEVGGGDNGGQARSLVLRDLRHAPGFRVQGSGFRVQGPGSRVQDAGSRVATLAVSHPLRERVLY